MFAPTKKVGITGGEFNGLDWSGDNADERRCSSVPTELAAIRKSVPNYHPILATTREIGDFCFAPLVTQKHALYCDLNILFLRSGKPGSLMVDGDIDNRLKTLFDALRPPRSLNELPKNAKPTADEKPYFRCLLEDDSLITGFDVVADRLLVPANQANEVRLVIHVHIEPQFRTADNSAF